LTEGAGEHVAGRINRLVEPFGAIDAARHVWMPQGLSNPTEARLSEAAKLLSRDRREALSTWWLAVRERANTPNWDIASTAIIDGREGLILIEAKAHAAELKQDGYGAGTDQNRERIHGAIAEANTELNNSCDGWGLSCESNYQLANRFAWSWKLASLRVPVILVYLGFLKAEEMRDQGVPFATPDSWKQAVRVHARGVVPDHTWGQAVDIAGNPMIPLIRSIEVPLSGLPTKGRAA
jgi:hypothetical protein